tara:strand:+ start:366 stop:1514 length:1149 start_codon:yes stop_codon:yes gene_type:complete
MKRNSGFIGQSADTNTDTAKGLHDLHDVHIKRSGDRWPRTELFASLTPSTSNVTEGNSMTFTLVTEHINNDTTLYYTISTTSGLGMNDADFSASPNDNGVAGSFTNTNDSTVLTFGLVAEMDPGDAETNAFKLQIRTGSTSGTIVIESSNVIVTDAVATGTDIRTAFYEISNRVITDSSSGDYTGAYDVGEVQQAYTGSARIYLAFKCTTSTTYINDICVAAVQVLNSSNAIQQTWNFSSNSNQSWETRTTRVNGSSSLLSSYLTPTQAAAYSYSSLGQPSGATRVGLATGTSSSYTGTADGIANSTSTVYSVGNGTVTQSSGTYYIYGEVSGAARYSSVFARSPSYSFSGGDKIRVVHAVTTQSSMVSSININDSLWIGIY